MLHVLKLFLNLYLYHMESGSNVARSIVTILLYGYH
jgi:hypothetical protein